MTDVTVVIPAHNEESVIARAIESMTRDGGVKVIVVANGCTDATASVAVAASDAVRVIEIPESSKIKALNAVPEDVTYPVAYVDADVVVRGQVLHALAARLKDGSAEVAAPRMHVSPSQSWWVRQYFRVWALTAYRTESHIGSGLYMLTRAGRCRFGEFPDVIADDLFVQRLFLPAERLVPQDLSFSIDPPASLNSLLRRNTRIAAGNRQLAMLFPSLSAPSGARTLLSRVWRRPRLWTGFGVYAAVYLIAHGRAACLMRHQAPIAWNRDETSRALRT